AEVDGRLRELPAGAVDEDVDLVVIAPNAIEERRHALGLADIDAVAGAGEALRRDRPHDPGDLVLVAPGDDDMRSEPREKPGDRPADAACPAGHDGHLARH